MPARSDRPLNEVRREDVLTHLHDPLRRPEAGEAHRRWLTVSVPSARQQKGFRNMRGFRSLEDPALMLIVSEWDSPADSDAYLNSPAHDEMMGGYGDLIQAVEARHSCILIE